MATLSFDQSRIYTQEEVDAYELACIKHFKGVGGNVPFAEFLKSAGTLPYFHDIPVNERFYLAHQPFSILDGNVYAGVRYPNERIGEIKTCSGLNFIRLRDRQPYGLDIRNFITWARDLNGIIHVPTGVVNRHIFEINKNANPYLTLREVLQEMVNFIGSRHVYFTDEYVKVADSRLSTGYRNKRIVNAHFAEGVFDGSH